MTSLFHEMAIPRRWTTPDKGAGKAPGIAAGQGEHDILENQNECDGDGKGAVGPPAERAEAEALEEYSDTPDKQGGHDDRQKKVASQHGNDVVDRVRSYHVDLAVGHLNDPHDAHDKGQTQSDEDIDARKREPVQHALR